MVVNERPLTGLMREREGERDVYKTYMYTLIDELCFKLAIVSPLELTGVEWITFRMRLCRDREKQRERKREGGREGTV